MKTSIKILVISALTLSQAFAQELNCNEWAQKLKASASQAKELELLLLKLPDLETLCSNPKETEKQIFEVLWRLEKQKRLDLTLKGLIKKLKAQNKIPALSKVDDDFAVAMLGGAIRSEFYDRGFYVPAYVFAGWETITKKQEETLLRFPKVSSFKSEGFKPILKQLTGASMTNMTNFKILQKNGEAFDARLELIRNAKNSIKLMTWGFYDDQTGKAVADELINATNRNVRVQLIVDGLVAQRPGYSSYLQSMVKAGVEVVFWKSTKNPFYGMHSKTLIVDDLYCVDGGRNIGKYYLEDNKWSDLDVYYEGTLAEVVNPNLFAKIWNEQVSLQKLKYAPLVENKVSLPNGNTATFLADPQHLTTDAISNITIYAIKSAKSEIDIANAYFIATPGIKKALAEAIQRGVKVRIFSNSMQSVDEPIVSISMQKSLNEMFKLGAEIFVKNGQTLHTKIFRADDLAWFGSYNLHPRSARYELEKATVSTEYLFVRDLKVVFENSLKEGKRITDIKELAYPQDPGMDILFSIIFNQL